MGVANRQRATPPLTTGGQPALRAQVIHFINKPMPGRLPKKTARALLDIEDPKVVPIIRDAAKVTEDSDAVFYFPGCGSERLFSQVGLATQAMLYELGAQCVLPPGYLAFARRLTREHGALLVLDEVQTGIGRTGEWFAYQHPDVLGVAGAEGSAGADVLPDVVTLAKGLGGGFPVGAVIAFGEGPARLLGRGQHGSTFGGNPVAAAAGLATLGVIERDGLLAHVRETGDLLRREIEAGGNTLVAGVRGRGLLLAVRLTAPVAPRVVAAALEAGFIVNAVAPDVVRLAPPLILTTDQAREAAAFFAGLPASLAEDTEETP
jgi:adenosylmethionine-8-amino-7-oxononanoate aminotransferase